MRELNLNRDEAEMLVDLCENTSDHRLWEVAATLRRQWGMVPQEMDHNAIYEKPKADSIAYLGLQRIP